jgi:RHS repeat-associated protein
MPQEQFTYDGAGNRLTMVGQSSPPAQTTVYTYDFEGRLIELDSPGLIAQYKYDPFGRRIEKNVNGVVSRYVYDGPNIAAEYDGDWNLVTKYLPSLGIDDPLAMEQAMGSYFYHKDGLGTVTDLTNTSGSAVKNYRYRSFWEIYSETGSLVQPFTFTGREYDPESGLYYYRARYYDPRAGRFISKDPIGFAAPDVNLYRYVDIVGEPHFETNLYRYAGNNPVNFVDPLGLWSITLERYLPGFGWGGGITSGRNPGPNPNRRGFISFRLGYGRGWIVAYDPNGQRPGWDPCSSSDKMGLGLGIYGNAGYGLVTVNAGVSYSAGINLLDGSYYSAIGWRFVGLVSMGASAGSGFEIIFW